MARIPARTSSFSLKNISPSPPPLLQLLALVHSDALPSPRAPTSHTTKNGRLLHHYNSLITQHGRSGDLPQAQSVFDRMPFRDVVSWTALLTAYGSNGDISSAWRVFNHMPCRNSASWNAMISTYVQGSRVSDAYKLFEHMPEKNAVSYSVMIAGFAKSGMLKEAEVLYREMPQEWQDPVASNALISGYLKVGRLVEAVRVFEMMEVRDVVTWSSILDGYCKHGRINDAREVFKEMPERNVVSWTTIIRGCFKAGLWEDGIGLFLVMRREGVRANATTLSVVVDACTQFGQIREGIQIHGLVSKSGFDNDAFLANSMIVMYSSVGWMNAARKTFDCLEKKDVVSWNSLLTAYVRHDAMEEANALFEAMPKTDVVSWTSMIVGFSNRGWIKESIRLFHQMPEKDEVAWTSIISGFVANSEHENAQNCFCQMIQEGYRPNAPALSSLLSASACLANLSHGMQIHACILKMNLDTDVAIQSSLISMYAKCGKLSDAHCVFLSVREPKLITVNSMLTAFAQHGLAAEALRLFGDMQEYDCKPNNVTFLGVLSACVHSGLVEEGYEHFKSMMPAYGIEPGRDHYTCIVDLLGRAGWLKEAVELINSMTFDPHPEVWGALLNASRMHSNLEFAELAANHLLELEPNNSTPYAVLSKMYSLAGRKEEGDMVSMVKKSKGVRKEPGLSWIAFGNCMPVEHHLNAFPAGA